MAKQKKYIYISSSLLSIDGGIRVEKFDLPLLGSDQCLEQLRTIQLWDSKPFPADSLCTVASTNSSRCRVKRVFYLPLFRRLKTLRSLPWSRFQDLASDRGTGLFCPVPEKSGRPLGSSQRYVQVGISSWGRGCNDEPGMYTSVPFFSPWLQKAVTDRIPAWKMPPLNEWLDTWLLTRNSWHLMACFNSGPCTGIVLHHFKAWKNWVRENFHFFQHDISFLNGAFVLKRNWIR